MKLIEISHLYKTYKTSNKNNDVLKDVSLTLPDNGLVVILGKSGSGKSTLLNIIGGIDKPSKGKVNFYGLSLFNKLFSKRNEFISYVFQHYHLLENETPFYNIILPGLIRGYKRKKLDLIAKKFLKEFAINEECWKKETRLLSGGEKARVAIIRALICNPKVILADEPTGALDEQNALNTIQILKKESQKRLVVLVTHNKNFANKFADRIIEIKEGSILSDKIINKPKHLLEKNIEKTKHKDNWNNHFIFRNFVRRFKRNIVSICGISLSLIFCYLLIGFSNNSNASINQAARKHFDYGSGLINREIKNNFSESKLTLIKTVRPSYEDIEEISSFSDDFLIMNNYDFFFNNAQILAKNNKKLNLSFSYVYDFKENYCNYNLVEEFKKKEQYSLFDVVVNSSAEKIIDNQQINIALDFEYNFINKEGKEEIDQLTIHGPLNIVGICEELSFLSVPKIYFNYHQIDDFLAQKSLENYSVNINENVSWKDLVGNANNNDEISSYSYRCFLKDYKKLDKVEDFSSYFDDELKFESDGLTIKEALESLTYAANIGLEIFLLIAFIGSLLILGIFSFSAYNDDKKISSILTCLGARNSDVIDIYVSESLICVILSFVISTFLSLTITKPINFLIENVTSLPSLIKIPFRLFLGRKFFLPIVVFIGVTLTSAVFTAVPILLSKSLSLKKELAEL